MIVKRRTYPPVTIATSRGPAEVTCAWRGAFFAATQNIPTEGYGFAVTHLPTGRRVFASTSQRRAVTWARALEALLGKDTRIGSSSTFVLRRVFGSELVALLEAEREQ